MHMRMDQFFIHIPLCNLTLFKNHKQAHAYIDELNMIFIMRVEYEREKNQQQQQQTKRTQHTHHTISFCNALFSFWFIVTLARNRK